MHQTHFCKKGEIKKLEEIVIKPLFRLLHK